MVYYLRIFPELMICKENNVNVSFPHLISTSVKNQLEKHHLRDTPAFYNGVVCFDSNGSFYLGSITSCCSGNEPTLTLPRTDGWTHGLAIVNYHQSDRCLHKSSRQHRFIFLEQISNGGCKGVV